ncbi:unnamed protein product [Ectocarpus sp. CCAP 1310/34]|nr:unnamed protein product [Ectocarpus sp. CCAP 1310/34]
MCREHAGPGWVDVVRIGGGSEDNTTAVGDRAIDAPVRREETTGGMIDCRRCSVCAAVGRSGCNSDSSSNNHINTGGGSNVDPGGPAVGGGEGSDARASAAGALGGVTRPGRLLGRPKGVNDQCPHPNSKHYCHGKCKVCYMKEYNQKTRMQGAAAQATSSQATSSRATLAQRTTAGEAVPEGQAGGTTISDKHWRRTVSSCEHADAPHYGKGFCRPCYMVSGEGAKKDRGAFCGREYNKAKRRGENVVRLNCPRPEASPSSTPAAAAAATGAPASSAKEGGNGVGGGSSSSFSWPSSKTGGKLALAPTPPPVTAAISAAAAAAMRASSSVPKTTALPPPICGRCKQTERSWPSVLVCDGCEATFHLGCAHMSSQPCGEWYCPRCTSFLLDSDSEADDAPPPPKEQTAAARVSSSDERPAEASSEATATVAAALVALAAEATTASEKARTSEAAAATSSRAVSEPAPEKSQGVEAPPAPGPSFDPAVEGSAGVGGGGSSSSSSLGMATTDRDSSGPAAGAGAGAGAAATAAAAAPTPGGGEAGSVADAPAGGGDASGGAAAARRPERRSAALRTPADGAEAAAAAAVAPKSVGGGSSAHHGKTDAGGRRQKRWSLRGDVRGCRCPDCVSILLQTGGSRPPEASSLLVSEEARSLPAPKIPEGTEHGVVIPRRGGLGVKRRRQRRSPRDPYALKEDRLRERETVPAPKRPGRPPGSANKPKPATGRTGTGRPVGRPKGSKNRVVASSPAAIRYGFGSSGREGGDSLQRVALPSRRELEVDTNGGGGLGSASASSGEGGGGRAGLRSTRGHNRRRFRGGSDDEWSFGGGWASDSDGGGSGSGINYRFGGDKVRRRRRAAGDVSDESYSMSDSGNSSSGGDGRRRGRKRGRGSAGASAGASAGPGGAGGVVVKRGPGRPRKTDCPAGGGGSGSGGGRARGAGLTSKRQPKAAAAAAAGEGGETVRKRASPRTSRKGVVTACEHTDRPLYSRGQCKPCYMVAYWNRKHAELGIKPRKHRSSEWVEKKRELQEAASRSEGGSVGSSEGLPSSGGVNNASAFPVSIPADSAARPSGVAAAATGSISRGGGREAINRKATGDSENRPQQGIISAPLPRAAGPGLPAGGGGSEASNGGGSAAAEDKTRQLVAGVAAAVSAAAAAAAAAPAPAPVREYVFPPDLRMGYAARPVVAAATSMATAPPPTPALTLPPPSLAPPALRMATRARLSTL